MSRFTIKNLMDVEDSAGERMPGVEGRFARKHRDSRHLGVSYFRYSPGLREAGEHGLELIAVGADRPEGGDGVLAPSAWIDELEE